MTIKQKPIEILINNKKAYLHFLTIVGSQLHKLTIKETSDIDIKGVITWDEAVKAELNEPIDLIDTNKLKAIYGADYTNIIKSIINQLNFHLNLKLNPEQDDIVLYEARKFYKDTMNNDFNMLDMLYGEEQIFRTFEFEKTLSIKEDFLKYQFIFDKFKNMAFNNLNKSKNQPEPLKFKSQVKAIQLLESLKVVLKTKKYNPVLDLKTREYLLKIKKGEIPFEEIEKRFKELDEEVQTKYEIPQNNINIDILNKTLVELNMFNIKEKTNPQKEEKQIPKGRINRFK